MNLAPILNHVVPCEIHHMVLYALIVLSVLILIASTIQIYHVWMDCNSRRKRRKYLAGRKADGSRPTDRRQLPR